MQPTATNVVDTAARPRFLRRVTDINNGDSYGGRALLRFTPTEALTVDLGASCEQVDAPIPLWRPDFSRANGFDFASNMHAENQRRGSQPHLPQRHRALQFDGFSVTGVTSYFDRDFVRTYDVSDTFNGRVGSAHDGRLRRRPQNSPGRARCRRYLLGITAATNTTQCNPSQVPRCSTRPCRSSPRCCTSRRAPTTGCTSCASIRPATGRSSGRSAASWKIAIRRCARRCSVADPRDRSPAGDSDPGALAYDRTVNNNWSGKRRVESSYKLFDTLTLTAGHALLRFQARRSGRRIDVGRSLQLRRRALYQIRV
ncbi:hypothetical protein AB5I41_11385 [Sphingomonas sp. MMS24-JH45]